jgi:hypothetical protein
MELGVVGGGRWRELTESSPAGYRANSTVQKQMLGAKRCTNNELPELPELPAAGRTASALCQPAQDTEQAGSSCRKHHCEILLVMHACHAKDANATFGVGCPTLHMFTPAHVGALIRELASATARQTHDHKSHTGLICTHFATAQRPRQLVCDAQQAGVCFGDAALPPAGAARRVGGPGSG